MSRLTGESDREHGMPGFLVIGAQKAGTTSLLKYLSRHQDICVPQTKELHYFTRHYYTRGVAWYRRQFRGAGKRVAGEATPYYLLHPQAPGRAHGLLPHAKIIVMLRNPIDRAYSHYQHNIARGERETMTFEQAIDAESSRVDAETVRLEQDDHCVSRPHHCYSYLARGRYLEQLQRWGSLYDRQQMLIVRSEDLWRDAADVHGQVLDFLGLERQPLKRYRVFNKRPNNAPKMEAKTRQYLEEYFRPFNERLYEWLWRDMAWA